MQGTAEAVAKMLDVPIAVLVLLLGGVVLLTVAPFEIGTIRLAGVSLLWWYAALAVPVAAVTVTVTALLRRDARRRAIAVPSE